MAPVLLENSMVVWDLGRDDVEYRTPAHEKEHEVKLLRDSPDESCGTASTAV